MKKIKLVDSTEVAALHLAAMETDYLTPKLFPLVAFLARTKYDDGEARKPGEARLKTKGTAWEIQLIDHDSRAHVRLIASTIDDVLAMTCLGLETEDLPWELADWLPKPKPKK